MVVRKFALVTGASSGIGRKYAIFLANSGYDLVVVARRENLLESLATELKDFGAQTRVVVADLSTDRGVQIVIDAARDIDLLVCEFVLSVLVMCEPRFIEMLV